MNSSLTGSGCRNALVLSGLQALGGANPAVVVALGGLVGSQLAPSTEMATLPVSLFNIGLALGVLPAAFIMRQKGRRFGYVMGSLLGASGGMLAFYGISIGSFLLFCLGTVLAGLYASYVQSYRFAAADSVEGPLKPKAISWVMIGGLVAAVLATQVILHTSDIIPSLPFAGTFIAQAMLALCALPLIAFLRNDPASHHTPAEQAQAQHGRPLLEIIKQPKFIVAVIAGTSSYSLMSFMMTASPLAMVGCGHSMRDSTLGIQWHILAMFGPSFFTGTLIRRFGKIAITLSGLLLIALASVVALNGLSVEHFWISLILLGLGWNFGFIGATAMVTDCYRNEERNRVQAFNDFLVFGSVAISSFSSGQLLVTHGWDGINTWTFPIVGVVVISLMWLWFHERNQAGIAAN